MQKSIERYGVGIVVGSVVTVGLLYLMQAVISSDKNPLNEAPSIRPVEIVRLLDDQPPPIIKRNIEPPPPPEQPPPELPDIEFDNSDTIGWGWDDGFGSVAVDPDLSLSGYSQDGEYLPIRHVRPNYPNRALQRGIEGYVILIFTVTETGTIEDAKVHEADPAGIFDRAALQAAEKFKYRPRVIDGVAIRVEGVKYRFTFELEDAE